MALAPFPAPTFSATALRQRRSPVVVEQVETFVLKDGRRAFKRPDTGTIMVIRGDGLLEFLR